MFEGFGPEKMVFLLVLLLLVFGAKRIPEIGAGLGKGIREFKKSMNEIGRDETPTQTLQPPASQNAQIAPPEKPPTAP